MKTMYLSNAIFLAGEFWYVIFGVVLAFVIGVLVWKGKQFFGRND